MAAQLTDEVAQLIMGEIHGVLRKLEQQQAKAEILALELDKVATGLEVQKRIIHNQNERVLLGQIEVVKQAAIAIQGSVEGIKGASSSIVETLCTPVVEELKRHIGELTDTEHAVKRLVGQAIELQQDIYASQEHANWSKIGVRILAFVAVASAFSAGYFLR